MLLPRDYSGRACGEVYRVPAHVIQMETFPLDDSHLSWSHGVGAARVAKVLRKALRGGKGT